MAIYIACDANCGTMSRNDDKKRNANNWLRLTVLTGSKNNYKKKELTYCDDCAKPIKELLKI